MQSPKEDILIAKCDALQNQRASSITQHANENHAHHLENFLHEPLLYHTIADENIEHSSSLSSIVGVAVEKSHLVPSRMLKSSQCMSLDTAILSFDIATKIENDLQMSN